MNSGQIAAIVKKKASQLSALDDSQIKLESKFVSDLGFDSLDHMDMLMSMEDEFEIEIPDKEAARVQTIADTVATIQRILSASSEVQMDKDQCIADLVELIERAIKSGDWKVDGACDPDQAIERAKCILRKSGQQQNVADNSFAAAA